MIIENETLEKLKIFTMSTYITSWGGISTATNSALEKLILPTVADSSTGGVLNTIGADAITTTTALGTLTIFNSVCSHTSLVIDNNKPCSVIEKNAKKVYDKYDKNHVKSKNEGVSLVAIDEEVTKLVIDITENAKSKEELVRSLTAIESVLLESSGQNYMETSKDKVKVLEYGKDKA